jgi:hypothetical protein
MRAIAVSAISVEACTLLAGKMTIFSVEESLHDLGELAPGCR